MTVFDPSGGRLCRAHARMDEGHYRALCRDARSLKPLARSEDVLRALMAPAPTRVIGYGDRKHELPLRISLLEFGNSEDHPSLQLADVIAGAVIIWCMVNSGRRPRTDYHERLAGTKLQELCVGTMLPSLAPAASQPPKAGEVSLVDGNTAFLVRSGSLRSPKRDNEGRERACNRGRSVLLPRDAEAWA